VYINAPWIRNIYIATDSPAPSWLAEHPRVRIVRSEEFFADPSVLPTHNSQAVESQLHNIPGLSEYFLYSNDDMFFGRPVGPDMFFSPGGLTKFIEATTRIGLGENDPRRSGFENSARVNRALLRERFGRVTTRHLEHTAAPLRRSVVEELEREFPDDFARTAAARFRSPTDISVTNSLYHYYALFTGRAVQKIGAKVLYVDTTTRKGLEVLDRLLVRRSFDFFCLNDGSFPEVTADERARAMRAFLEKYFAIPAPWERTVADVGAATSELTAG
jgi:UDP-glucose 4-epimerase